MMDKIVISLAIINSRLNNLINIINNIINQSLKPDILHIFYSDNKFLLDEGINEKDIIKIIELAELKYNTNQIVDIKLTKTENIGSYRKLIPALKLYKDSLIITIDDDHIFENTFIEKFIVSYNHYKCIICSFAERFNSNDIVPCHKPETSILPIGAGGILYHTNMFKKDITLFDYKSLDLEIIKNDDIFFRYYTILEKINVCKIKIIKKEFLSPNGLYKNFNFKKNNTDILNKLDILFKNKIDLCNNNIINVISANLERKILHYDTTFFIEEGNNEDLDLNLIISKKMNINKQENIILINLEKDKLRYNYAIEELKIFKSKNFYHLKGIYWKEKNFDKKIYDLLCFLSKYNKDISLDNIFSDEFHNVKNKKIKISKGPLGCFFSHVHALIYGFLNFKNYIIILEDDFSVKNTKLIEENIKLIPDDWDIIFLNCIPIPNIGVNYSNDDIYSKKFYKLNTNFHSFHSYIVNLKNIDKIFSNLYPIDDQIDIKISSLYDKLNFYNIPDTCYQKNFSSNTQNNLEIVYTTPGYSNIRKEINSLKLTLKNLIYHKTGYCKINIADNIINDVVFNYIIYNSNKNITSDYTEKKYDINIIKIESFLFNIINSCSKGIQIKNTVKILINDIYEIIETFDKNLEIISYGSTSNCYLNNNNNILKIYNKKLRWKNLTHKNLDEIYSREINILKKIKHLKYTPIMLDYNLEKKIIEFKYHGESLYDNFCLPGDWLKQINEFFQVMDENKIYYPEFNIKNILVYENNITIIDYGLAINDYDKNNKNNKEVFILLLDMFNNKINTFENYKDITKKETIKIIYNTWISDLKDTKKYSENIF